MKRLLLPAAILIALLLATTPAFAQQDPDTPVSGRPGEDPGSPSDCQKLRATGADIDCGVPRDAKTASGHQYAGQDQYGPDRSSETGISGGTGVLPRTGGSAFLPLSVGFLLITVGLLARRFDRLRR